MSSNKASRLRDLGATFLEARRRSYELGIGELGHNERLVLLAVAAIALDSRDAFARRGQVDRHPFTQEMASPTVSRALAALIEKKLLSHPPGYRAAWYCLGPQLSAASPDDRVANEDSSR